MQGHTACGGPSMVMRHRMLGHERSLLYRFEQFDLDAGMVYSEAGQQKNRRRHDVRLRSEMVTMLRKHLAGRNPKAKAFRVPQRCASMLRLDMEAAGLDSNGYDFHCLRRQVPATQCTSLQPNAASRYDKRGTGGRAAEGTGLLNRRRGNPLPRVRIPPCPLRAVLAELVLLRRGNIPHCEI